MFEKVSAHESIREMYEKVHADGVTNVFDRYKAQGDKRCPFCTQGISCALCSNGPCRITPKADRGVCGIDADGMAMRNMLLRNILGAATYAYHANEVFKTLKATARGKTPFEIKDEAKLQAACKALGFDGTSKEELAEKLADEFLADLHRDQTEPSRMVEAYAPAKRKDIWRKLGIFPGGCLHEVMREVSSCLTNVDGYYESLALKAMRLGISMAYSAQLALEIGQDILYGTPKPHEMEFDLGVLDPDYVNIVPNGHEPFLGAAIIKLAHKPDIQEKAKVAGAKGLRVVGSIETGQELVQRFEKDDVFVGMSGNWLGTEMLLATGAVDLFAVDMNCTVPPLCTVARTYGTELVLVSELVRVEGCDKTMDYHPEKAEEQARKLIDLAIANFPTRKAQVKPDIPKNRQKAIVGFSTESILEALGGSLDPLLDLIKDGTIKGVAGLVSCTTLKNGPQDEMTISVAKELISRDILVLAMGCGVAALQVGGLCASEASELAGSGLKAVCEKLGTPPVLAYGTCTDTGRVAHLVGVIADALGVDTCDLPVVVTAPEYMEQKATIDAIFAIAYGLYTHVSPVPPVTGGPRLVELLTSRIEDLTGGKIAIGDDPVEAVSGMEKHILKKREALGI